MVEGPSRPLAAVDLRDAEEWSEDHDAEEWSEDHDAEEWSEDHDAEEWSEDHSGAGPSTIPLRHRSTFASRRA